MKTIIAKIIFYGFVSIFILTAFVYIPFMIAKFKGVLITICILSVACVFTWATVYLITNNH